MKMIPRQTIRYLKFTAPIRIISEANNCENWSKKHKRKISQQQEITVELHNVLNGRNIQLPCQITFTRIGPKSLDADNLANSFKAVQDSVSRKLGFDDGDTSKVTWHYEQRAIGKRQYSLEVEIKSDESQHQTPRS